MLERDYLIVGAGPAGASACEALREHDPKNPVMLVGAESILPFHRRPLFGSGESRKAKTPNPLAHLDAAWFAKHKVDLRLDIWVREFNYERRLAVLSTGQAVQFRKACLAMGSRAKKPPVSGANLGNVIYLRNVRDESMLDELLEGSKNVVIIGGGMLATEAAARLRQLKRDVILLHRGRSLLGRRLDPETSAWLTSYAEEHGVKLMLGEALNGFEGKTVLRNVQTKSGQRIPADLALVAVGTEPNLELVTNTPLSSPSGSPVTDLLECDEKGIYSAGDIAFFPDKFAGGMRRIEDIGTAIAQGRIAGANMSGRKRQRFEHVPVQTTELWDLRLDWLGDFTRPHPRAELVGDRKKKHWSVRFFEGTALRAVLLCNESPQAVDHAREEISGPNKH
jgi:3-phenylpropionate/trans-cinnamate dioxygenase ferredoxin reductase subunit